MDEHAEERRELAEIQRDDRDDAREHAEARDYYADDGLSHTERVTLETARWSR